MAKDIFDVSLHPNEQAFFVLLNILVVDFIFIEKPLFENFILKSGLKMERWSTLGHVRIFC
jgi:hypothetical protein